MKLLYHPLTILVLTIISLLFYFSLRKSTQKLTLTQDSIQQLEGEIDTLAEEKLELESALEYATSSAGQEEIIRNELLLQKPGEFVVHLPALDEFLVEPTPAPSPTAWQEWQQVLW